ncbi:hypothetical protein [Micromonospora pisi]|nr:hypothetical protein [Micromonospora pisi]
MLILEELTGRRVLVRPWWTMGGPVDVVRPAEGQRTRLSVEVG